jgi:ligand-binding sensor protein
MTAIAQDGALPPPHPEAGVIGRHEISLTRIYLPFAMVITFGVFLVVAGYTVGSVMSGIARDKTETDKRLSAIEKEMTAIKNILAERAEATPCFGRPK